MTVVQKMDDLQTAGMRVRWTMDGCGEKGGNGRWGTIRVVVDHPARPSSLATDEGPIRICLSGMKTLSGLAYPPRIPQSAVPERFGVRGSG